ncbi:MAG TPA: ATP-dependent DNA helicase, partial [Pseudonocardiaceae bacterium]|nr:ATP-dependent DNA helicase [Pseudonocardiaceae bacterium]
GGDAREGQLRMAEAVAQAIETGEHLAVQAGTGTGKSLAYLVPSIRHAVRYGKTVVVSTATIALQRQLVDRDLPRLAKTLERHLGRAPTFAILKGRRNYLCLHRLHEGAPEEPDELALFDPFAASALGRQVRRLQEWAAGTETGDRDEVVPGVNEQAWRQVSVSARECLGLARCPVGSDCFAERARAEAGKVDVVVTNHALLAIDAMESVTVLPDHDLVVVDEAHDLVDRVTSVATAELTASAVAAAAKRCVRLVEDSTVDKLSEAADGLAMVLAGAPVGRWERLGEAVGTTLTAVRDAAWTCRTALGPNRREETDQATQRKLALALLEDVHDTAVRVLAAFAESDPASRREVVWLADEERRGLVVRVAPLSVAGLLRERLFGQSTVVLTSATLALGGAFDALARQWGLPAEPAGPAEATKPVDGMASKRTPPADGDVPRWTGLDVGSPFEYRKRAILYVAKHLPAPGRDGLPPVYLDEIEQLVTAAGGRTLGLFSSMRAARLAADELTERLDLPVLCQGDDSTAQLVKKFAKDERTCLFGTLSLWQGVDVPGPSLQLVIVDRIPFPRPDDPLMSSRQRAVDARGGSGFMTVAASHAALRLAQGAGRLVRSMSDRGVVAVLDPRLMTARYGSFLRASLPPFWPTTDPAVVRAALRRIDTATKQPASTASR